MFEFCEKQGMKSILFYYHGGEATRHNRIIDILKHVKQRSAETGIVAYNEMQTNLTIKTDFLVELLEYCDMIDVTFHYLELKRRGQKLAAFVKNFEYIKAQNRTIQNFDIMMEDVPEEDVKELYDYILYFKSYPHIVNSEMIYGFYEYKDNERTHEQHVKFYHNHNQTEQRYLVDDVEYNTNELFANGLDCRGWKCAAGKKSIYVNGDGNVFVCGEPTTRYVKGDPNEKPYTNLISDGLALTKLTILAKSGTICKWDRCAGDFYVEREK
jgi:MoaA/NifB/PqqE/SkfB family radical SAM enzyme